MLNWSLSGSWLDVTSHQISVSLRGGPRGADVAISRNAVRCVKTHQSIEQFGDIQWTLVQKLLIDRTRRFPRALCALGMTCLKVRLIERQTEICKYLSQIGHSLYRFDKNSWHLSQRIVHFCLTIVFRASKIVLGMVYAAPVLDTGYRVS